MTRRIKKKSLQKLSVTKDSNQNMECGSSDDVLLPLFTATASKEDSEDWTPVQLEQIELASKLNEYINSFQKKLLSLSSAPSDRELVILFIMYLHPRWRRFVEPMELSCSTWIEAAAYAKLHCGRISAMLGCEKLGSGCIFKTPESRALRDSGYFAPETPVPEDSSSSSQNCADKLVNNININQNDTDDSKSDSTASIASSNSTTKVKQEQQHNFEEEMEEKATTGNNDVAIEENNGTDSTENEHSDNLEDTEMQEECDIPDVVDNDRNNSLLEQDANISKEIASFIPTKLGGRKKKVKRNMAYEKPIVDATDLIVNYIPQGYENVNLTFLELSVNGKKVKTLLAKFSFGSSAISVNCANRVGITWNKSDDHRFETGFGYVEALGDLTLPFSHPADPKNIKFEIRASVLPKIYGENVDLVLGADFFSKYQPVLNIKTRSIFFLGKETPYLVEQLGG